MFGKKKKLLQEQQIKEDQNKKLEEEKLLDQKYFELTGQHKSEVKNIKIEED